MKEKRRTRPPEGAENEVSQYDKVLKENLRHALPVLMTEILQFPPGSFKPVHIELQRTIERKADFMGKLYVSNALKTIAHLEIQAKDEKNMVLREYLYSALIANAYPTCDVEQVVFFIGKRRPKMATTLQRTHLHYEFKLVWIKDIHFSEFLKTGQPEIMLLGALAGYGDQTAQQVMTEVVHAVRKITKSDLAFDRLAEQLHILSNLHNLQQIFEKVMLNVSALIDERKDPFFKRGERIGIEKGERLGIEKGERLGIEKGFSENALRVIVKLILQSEHSDAFIANIADVEDTTVTQVRNIIRQHPDDFWGKLKSIQVAVKQGREQTMHTA